MHNLSTKIDNFPDFTKFIFKDADRSNPRILWVNFWTYPLQRDKIG